MIGEGTAGRGEEGTVGLLDKYSNSAFRPVAREGTCMQQQKVVRIRARHFFSVCTNES